MWTALASLASLVAGISIGWAARGYAVRKRKAKADELRFILAPTVPYTVEDAAREAGL